MDTWTYIETHTQDDILEDWKILATPYFHQFHNINCNILSDYTAPYWFEIKSETPMDYFIEEYRDDLK